MRPTNKRLQPTVRSSRSWVRRSLGIAGLEVRNFESGAPYLCLSTSPVGPVQLLRLVDRKPLIRDQLHKAPERIWELHPRLAEARERFRRSLLDNIPGARVSGDAGRVEASVTALTERRDVVLHALSDLARELLVPVVGQPN